ncbi:hypothetical protein B7494_g7207 [Chlorociboria aeruginascens]|nr:hypothetical protein B7494_g7207 [Chlorociboria aeruginascens]
MPRGRQPEAEQMIAPRSVAAPPALSRRCCLRCAKRWAKEPDQRCKLSSSGSTVCDRCRRQRANCMKVPPKYNERLNKLMKLADRTHTGLARDNTFDTAPLKKLQKSFTANVERYMRIKARRGIDKIPTDMNAMMGSLLGYMDHLCETMDIIMDTMRFHANLPPIVNDEDEEDFDGDSSSAPSEAPTSSSLSSSSSLLENHSSG